MRLFWRLGRIVLRPVLKLIFGVKVEGLEHLAMWENGLIVANHLSYFDPPLIGVLMKREINFLAKAELFKIPVLSALIKKFNAYPIKRGVVDRAGLQTVMRALQTGKSFLVFPEGSRKNFTAKGGVGKIIHELNTDILPICIENSNRIFACMLRRCRVKIFIGEPLTAAAVKSNAEGTEAYRQAAQRILQRINELPAEFMEEGAKSDS